MSFGAKVCGGENSTDDHQLPFDVRECLEGITHSIFVPKFWVPLAKSIAKIFIFDFGRELSGGVADLLRFDKSPKPMVFVEDVSDRLHEVFTG